MLGGMNKITVKGRIIDYCRTATRRDPSVEQTSVQMPHFQPADSDELSSCTWSGLQLHVAMWDSAPVSETELNEELRTQCKRWHADKQQSVQTKRRKKAPPAGKYRQGFPTFRMRATKKCRLKQAGQDNVMLARHEIRDDLETLRRLCHAVSAPSPPQQEAATPDTCVIDDSSSTSSSTPCWSAFSTCTPTQACTSIRNSPAHMPSYEGGGGQGHAPQGFFASSAPLPACGVRARREVRASGGTPPSSRGECTGRGGRAIKMPKRFLED